MELKHFIGIDVSKSTLDFAVHFQKKIVFQYQCENSRNGITKTVRELRKLKDFSIKTSVFCMEFTGIYNNHLLNYLLQCKSHIWLESALQIKQSQGITRGKNDQIDSIRIAEYAFTYQSKMKLWTPPGDAIKRLKGLIALRERLVNSLTALSTPLGENAGFIDKKQSALEAKLMKSSLAALKKSIEKTNQEMEQLIKEDQELHRQYKLITTVTGVGTIVAMNILAVTDGFKKFNTPNGFACYCGVVPFESRSGSSIRGRTRISHLANKKIKTLLHLAAMSAIHAKGEFKEYYERKVKAGKNKMSVLNAIRNKIIHRIFAVIKRQSPYQKKLSPALA